MKMQTPLPVVILAGGLGTGLGALTLALPKCLVDVDGEPFASHQLRLLRSNGIERVIFCVGHFGELVEKSIGDGSSLGMAIEYAFDGPRLLGTAGAIKRALRDLDETFFVTYGDSFLPCDFAAVRVTFERSKLSGLMTVFENEGCWDASNVEFADGKILSYDKVRKTARMRHIDYGLGLFDRRAFDGVADDTPYDLATVYQELLARNDLASHEVNERFYEVGSIAGLEETRALLASRC